ncbi:MAG: hypothetical protein ACLUAR_16560 [Pilosibacter sp.]
MRIARSYPSIREAGETGEELCKDIPVIGLDAGLAVVDVLLCANSWADSGNASAFTEEKSCISRRRISSFVNPSTKYRQASCRRW